ncbi:MAG: BON domain-containing protein [Planctomycetales bacterium]|nr:BON domain-containing protein [Planctomycetales bacterium]
MTDRLTTEELCRRIEISVQRLVEVVNFSCSEEGGKLILRGQVPSRDEAMMCIVVARSVPGVETVASEIKVAS